MKKHILSIMTALLLLIILSTTIASALDFGDIDGIGGITAGDARLALRAAVGLEKLNEQQKKAADVNTDGKITADDARSILRASVGLETLHNHSYTGTATKAATCTVNGVKTFTCSCGDSYTEAIPATGHKEVKDAAKAATCTATGLTEGKHCSVCGTVTVKQQTVAKKAHTEVKDAAKAATCTATGLTEGKHCSVCGTVIVAQQTVAKKAHTEVKDAAKAATCTATGLTEGKHCSVCGTVTVAQQTVSAKGHDIIIDKAVAATCKATGLTAGQHCSRCDAETVEQEIIPMTDHTEVTDTAVAATCTKTGLTEGKHCSVCDKILVPQEVTETIDHEYYDANCVEPAKCKTCGDTQGEINKDNHKNIVTDEAKEASCTETGLTEGSHCEACGEELEKQTVIDMLKHIGDATCTISAKCTVCGNDYIDEDNHPGFAPKTVSASCTMAGYTADHCTAEGCNYFKAESLVENIDDPATGHSFEPAPSVLPSCTEQGYDSEVCSKCDAENKFNYKDANGHDYEWDIIDEATCEKTGLRNGECLVCHDRIENDIIPLEACKTYYTEEVRNNSLFEHNMDIVRCTVCNKEVSRTEYHKPYKIGDDITPLTCETSQEFLQGCFACDYTEIIIVPTTGHEIPKAPDSLEPTCEDAGLYIFSGDCLKCGKHLNEAEVVIPADGHKTRTGTMQTCTTSEICDVCEEIIPGKEALGHDFSTSAAAFNNIEEIHHFFCNRCGAANENTLEVFNTLANNIKTNSYFTSTRSNKVYTANKTSTNMTYSRFDFGMFTSAFKEEFDKMSNEPDKYTRLSTTGTLTRTLPIQSFTTVSKLTKQDIEYITAEKLSGINIGDILSDFNPTNQQHVELLKKYKESSFSGDIIKVTIDVKNEKLTEVKKLPQGTETALSKIYNYDILGSADQALEDFMGDNGLEADGINFEVKLPEFSTDAKVTYYFKADTFDPIIALYDITERAEITADITIPLGILNFSGGFDPDIKMTTTYVYFFPYLFN